MTMAGHAAGGATHERVRYRVMLAKKEERTIGPDASEATVEITAPITVVASEGFDAAVAFMQGKISATGHIGTVLEVLANGEATSALISLASPI
jgi:hypothetical protein